MEDAVKRKVFKWYKKIRESRWFYEVIYAGLLIPVLFDLVPMQYCSRVMEEFFQKAGDAYAVISAKDLRHIRIRCMAKGFTI